MVLPGGVFYGKLFFRPCGHFHTEGRLSIAPSLATLAGCGISLALAGAALPAWACFCPPDEPGEFLHLAPAKGKRPPSVTLPANARGILFRPGEYPDTLVSDEDGYSIVAPPVALSAKRFHIQERGTGRKLTPVVVRLHVEKQMGLQDEGSFLANTEMQQCDKQERPLTPFCRTLAALKWDWSKQEQDGPSDKVKRFALQNGLRNISEEVDAAYGLYRVEAREGFQPGKVYDIVYRDGGRRVRAELRMATTPLNMHGPTPFAVRVDGAARREQLRMARGGSCDMLVTLASQPLRLALSPAYEAYQPLLMYFMQEKLEQRDRQQVSATPRFTPFQYWPTVCTKIPYGSSFHGQGRELAIGDCQAPAPRQVKAYAGVLEVEDSLHETAPLALAFPAEKPGQCPKMLDKIYPIYAVPAKAG